MQNKYFFLPAILFIGIVTSYEDIRIGKIRNIWIIIGLIYAVILYFIIGIFKTISFNVLLSNFIISILIGYLLWEFNLWSAGDAKLFIVYSLLLPIEIYPRIYFRFFPALNLLINIFLPATAFLLTKAIIDLAKKYEFKDIRNKSCDYLNKIKFDLVRVILGFSFIFLFSQIIRQQITGLVARFIPHRNILLLISFLAYKPLSTFFKRSKKLLLVIFLLFSAYLVCKRAYFLCFDLIEIFRALKMAILIMLLSVGCRKIINLYIDNSRIKTLPFAIWIFFGALITWFSICLSLKMILR